MLPSWCLQTSPLWPKVMIRWLTAAILLDAVALELSNEEAVNGTMGCMTLECLKVWVFTQFWSKKFYSWLAGMGFN